MHQSLGCFKDRSLSRKRGGGRCRLDFIFQAGDKPLSETGRWSKKDLILAVVGIIVLFERKAVFVMKIFFRLNDGSKKKFSNMLINFDIGC